MSIYFRTSPDGAYGVRLSTVFPQYDIKSESELAAIVPGSENGRLKYVIFSDGILNSFCKEYEMGHIFKENGYKYVYLLKPEEGDIAFRLNNKQELETSTNFYIFKDGHYHPMADSRKLKENTLITTVIKPEGI